MRQALKLVTDRPKYRVSPATTEVAAAYKALGSLLDEIALSNENELAHFFSDEQLQDTERSRLGQLAQEMLSERRLRDRVIRQAVFGEPVWDLLLDLYVAYASGRPVTVSGACASAGCPPTTALRYIDHLEGKDLIAKTRSDQDARMVLVQLTPKSVAMMTDYLSRIAERRQGKKG